MKDEPAYVSSTPLPPSNRGARRRFPLACTLAAVALSLTACTGVRSTTATPVALPQRVELSGGGTKALNYTPWYIHRFGIRGPAGTDIGGGGSNVMPIRENGRPSTSGEMCCTSYPRQWQSDLRLTVRWLVFKDVKTLGRDAPGIWYKAENVLIPQYDVSQSGGVWAIFLPGDQVKIMVADGNASGHNSVAQRPADDDPHVAQGVPDGEWNQLYPNGVARRGVAR